LFQEESPLHDWPEFLDMAEEWLKTAGMLDLRKCYRIYCIDIPQGYPVYRKFKFKNIDDHAVAV
jgi:hypothetical protein